ncbi:MAG: VWA domain-containing protein [Spirochaetota bacterium]
MKKLLFLIIAFVFIFGCADSKMAKVSSDDKSLRDEVAADTSSAKQDMERAKASSEEKDASGYKEAKKASEPASPSKKKKNGDSKADMAAPAGAPSPRESSAGAGVGGGRSTVPSSSGLKAGFADDNKQFNYFVKFLEQYKGSAKHYPANIEERIILKVFDFKNKSIANAKIDIFADKKQLCSGRTYADGSFLFFPSEYGNKPAAYRAVITSQQKSKEIKIDRQGKREIDVNFDGLRPEMKNIPIDILFILDTTGSMGEEISRLKDTIEIINMNIASISSKPKVRFGMVLYRDKDEEYLTKIIPLTDDLDRFREELNKVEANGGGDGPEDLQSALSDALTKIKWNNNGIRLSFIITDAPPHIDYGQKYTYINAARDARQKGIKIFSVGTGGLDINGEYVLRQLSQYTYSKYIFLTYGERGEAEGGKEGSVSHHTGANFQTDKLESIIIRFAKEELSFQSDKPLEQGEEFIQAVKIKDEQNEATLKKLNDMCIAQLIDYSSIGIPLGTTVSVIPFASDNKALKSNAEYFTEQMAFSLARNKTFKIVERKDMQKILKELELQFTGLVKDESAVKAGKLIGAKMIITGNIYEKPANYEIFLKLLRVETGEVVSVNKLRIDRMLGLSK